MTRITTAAKVGAFTVILVIAGVLIYRFADKTGDASGGYTVFCRIDDAMGIARHSGVKVAGIDIGHIQSIRLDQGKARIDIRVRPDVDLYEDAAVYKKTSSLLGEYFLSIAPGTEGRRKLVDGDEIFLVVEATTTDDIMKDLSEIAEQVKRVVAALADSVGTDEGKQNMRDTLQNLADVTDALNQTVRENRESIRNILVRVEGIAAQGGPEIERILENVRVVTQDVRQLVAQAPAAEDGAPGEVRSIFQKVDRASSNLERTLENLEAVSSRLERGEGTLGRLTKDERLIDEVEGVVEGVGSFVGGLQRMQTIVSLRADYLFRAGAVKSFVELRLQPREDKYYSLEIVNDPRGSTRIQQIDVQTTNPNEPAQYREIRNVTTNTFRFSLQFAQRFGPLVGRFGIKESTGGAGLDLILLDDRFELQQDLFGFGEVIRPRWRVTLSYAFVKRLWLLGGADDILSGDRRDYYVGLMLRFNDEDLKSILPFAPSP
jgi:phospholipid/cholesterol/gamma-HCH transport system substrate-binding protein